MGKKGNDKGGADKASTPAAKAAAKKEKDRKAKEDKATRLAARQERNRRRFQPEGDATMSDATTKQDELTAEQTKAREENLAKKAAARAKMLQDKEARKHREMLLTAVANNKLQRERDVAKGKIARAEYLANQALMAEEESKRKHEHSRNDSPVSPIRGANIVDLETASPIKKRQKNDDVMDTVIEIGTEDEEEETTEESEIAAKPAKDTPLQEAAETEEGIVAPPDPKSILRKKKSMLDAASKDVVPGTNPFFKPKTPGSNKEGIPPAEFANEVFIEATVTVPKKPVDFVGTDTKWAIAQITKFISQAQKDLAPLISFILLVYVRSSKMEPEAMKDTKKYLTGTINSVKKYADQFRVNTKAAGKGNEYQMYLKLRVGTNAFGEDLQQMLVDLKSVSSNVAVYPSILQKPNTNVINWILNSHRSFDISWLTSWVDTVCVHLHAGTCKQTLPGLDKSVFKGRDKLCLGFQWKPVYDGKNKAERAEAGLEQVYAIHVICEKKDKSLARALSYSLFESGGFARSVSLEFRMAPCFQNDNGPAERLKLLESLANHKHVQNKIISTVIPDLLSLDVRAPPTAEQVATDADDTATAVAEKRNPTARMLLMRLEKKDMPGVKLFTDVSLNFSKSDYIASAPEVWKDEARFVAANAAAFLYRRFGEVGLSFFLPHVGTQVKDQGWNEEEDRPVTAGEEGLNRVLKPYAKDSPMTKMFDFSKMDDTPLKKDLQNPGGRPAKDSTDVSPNINPQKLAFQDALSLADRSAFYHADGSPREPSGQAHVTFGENTTVGTGLDGDDGTILSDEEMDETVLEEDPPAASVTGEESVVSNMTSASRRSAGSRAREKRHQDERDQFNATLNQVKERHSQELQQTKQIMAKLQQQMEALQAAQSNGSLEDWSPPTSVNGDREMIVPPTAVSQENTTPSDPLNQVISGTEDSTPPSPTVQDPPPPDDNQSEITDGEEDPYVDTELDEEIKRQEAWFHKNGIPLDSTAEEGMAEAESTIPPADPSNQDDHGTEDEAPTPLEIQETLPPADPPNPSDSGAEVPPPPAL